MRMAKMKRALIVVHKCREVEPILNALLNVRMRPDDLQHPDLLNYPWRLKQGTVHPRAVWKDIGGVRVEVWCIEDIMDPRWNSSSSEGKNAELPKLFNYLNIAPSLVIACGTAAFGREAAQMTGSVVVGTHIYINNFHPNGENAESNWDDPIHFGKDLSSSLPEDFFEIFDPHTRASMESRLLKTFLSPADRVQLLAEPDYLSLSSVNITNYHEYAEADELGIQALARQGIALPLGSVETTHGVVRAQSEAPFLFVSGIAERTGFDFGSNQKTEAQQYAASFNIGVCLAWMIGRIPEYI
jgi:hypothetical protein